MIFRTVLRRTLRLCCAALAFVGLVALGSAATQATYSDTNGQQLVRHSDPDEPMRVVAFGDIEDEILGFEDLLVAVGEGGHADFGVVLGDVAKHDLRARESYVEYLDALRRSRPDYPIYVVPGNHDRPREGETDEYARVFGPLNWWFVHGDVLFVGVDDSDGLLTESARETLHEAAHAAAAARHVFVFLHVPIFGAAVEPGTVPGRSGRAADRALAELRSGLGVDVDVVVSGHTSRWIVETDERGTLHVCCGAEPGLGWPADSTPQIAALFSVTDDDIRVEEIRVPYRQDLVATLPRVIHRRIYNRLRRRLAPIPVWAATLVALLICLLLRPRANREEA